MIWYNLKWVVFISVSPFVCVALDAYFWIIMGFGHSVAWRFITTYIYIARSMLLIGNSMVCANVHVKLKWNHIYQYQFKSSEINFFFSELVLFTHFYLANVDIIMTASNCLSQHVSIHHVVDSNSVEFIRMKCALSF